MNKMEEGESKKRSSFIDRLLNFIFKKRNLYIILILILAFALRAIVASNAEPIADEMNVALRSIDVHKSGTMNSVDQSHSFYFLNEIVYKIFGSINLFTARFTSVFFGILSILLVYLIVIKMINTKGLTQK